LRLILDTNEYLFAFGLVKAPICEKLIAVILEQFPQHAMRIPAKIVEEVRRNLTREVLREFFEFLDSLSITIDHDFLVPFELGAKYGSKGLKPADAFITAYTEWVGADILATENRHFLTLHVDLPFHIFSAERCIKLFKSSK